MDVSHSVLVHKVHLCCSRTMSLVGITSHERIDWIPIDVINFLSSVYHGILSRWKMVSHIAAIRIDIHFSNRMMRTTKRLRFDGLDISPFDRYCE